jgi:hypothetical protein
VDEVADLCSDYAAADLESVLVSEILFGSLLGYGFAYASVFFYLFI